MSLLLVPCLVVILSIDREISDVERLALTSLIDREGSDEIAPSPSLAFTSLID